MKIKEILSKDLNHEYEVEVSASAIEEGLNTRLKAIGNKAKIPGFRPGKAPLPLLKQRYKSDALSEVLEGFIEKGIQQIIKDHKLKPALKPKVDIKSFEEEKALVFNVTIEVLPTIKEIKLEGLTFKKYNIKVPPHEVKGFLERIANQSRETRPLKKSRKTQKGDVVILDFEGFVEDKPIQGGAGKDHKLEIGSGSFIPGFEEQLIGHEKGACVDVKVTFPKEYHEPNYANKLAHFKVTITDIHEVEPINVDEALAQKLGFKTVNEMEKWVEDNISQSYQAKSFLSTKRQVLDALADRFSFEVPPSMIDLEFDNIWEQLCRELKVDKEAVANVNMKPKDREKIFKEATEKTEEELLKEYRAIAERRVRLGILLAEIGNRNNLSVTQQELLNALMEKAREFPGQEKEVFDFYKKNESAMASLRAPLFENKVIEHILSQAKVTEKTLTPEELEKLLIREEEEAEEKIFSESQKPKSKAKAKKKDA